MNITSLWGSSEVAFDPMYFLLNTSYSTNVVIMLSHRRISTQHWLNLSCWLSISFKSGYDIFIHTSIYLDENEINRIWIFYIYICTKHGIKPLSFIHYHSIIISFIHSFIYTTWSVPLHDLTHCLICSTTWPDPLLDLLHYFDLTHCLTCSTTLTWPTAWPVPLLDLTHCLTCSTTWPDPLLDLLHYLSLPTTWRDPLLDLFHYLTSSITY